MMHGFVLAALATAFVFDEKFDSADERGLSPSIEIERHSALSHRHGEVAADGGYTILVPGNRHYLAMPSVGDFVLSADFELGIHSLEFGLGYEVWFGGGHVFRAYYDTDGALSFSLDGRRFHSGGVLPADARKRLVGTLSMSLEKGVLSVETFGERAEVAVAGTTDGKVGFDMTFSTGNQMTFRRVVLKTQDAPAPTKIGDYRFELSRCQGFSEPLVFEVGLSRYPTGEVLADVLLTGLLGTATNRIETGGREWGSMKDRLDTPALRFESSAGEEIAVLPLWNGVRDYADPEVRRRALLRSRHSGEAKMEIPEWPVRRRVVLPGLPPRWTLAAGYRFAMENPNRLAGNGPYEQIRDQDGRFVYEGGSIRRGCVAVKVVPTPDPKFVARIPKDLPRRDEAVAHARTQGYFLASTVPSFTVEIATHPGEFRPDEVTYETKLETVFGDPVASGVCLPIGVYHFIVDWRAGLKKGRETFVFEVLSDDEEGPCPATASGLPTLYAMANETKFLEETVFDPCAPFGGFQHYYALSTHYPDVGLSNRVWEALRPYCRKWFVQNNMRNMKDDDAFSAENVFLNGVADYSYSLDDSAQYGDRYDLTNPSAYRAKQLKLLADFYAERKPSAKLLTPERFRELLSAGKGLAAEEFKEMFNSCWKEFKAWARPRADALDADFERRLLAQNPKLARAGYGPMSLYTSAYKTPYWLRAASKGMALNPEFKRNGSFWVFEEYHHSCDYPICRATMFVAAYSMLYPEGRMIYPEIYYSAWGRCNDGAVFQAHPGKFRFVAGSHQRRLVYDYVYGTAFFRDGRFGYWRDYGFHARNPERETMAEFVAAWGKTLKNRPVASARAPFVMVDLDAFERHGDYLETECNYRIDAGEKVYGDWGDVCNTAEESIAYLHEKIALGGRVAPVVSDFRELDALTPEICEFVVLPPIVASTPPETLAAIRRLHARGVALLATEEVAGLEDLFGVRRTAPRRIVSLGRERFAHKLAAAQYEADGAETLLAANDGIPVVLAHRTRHGRTAFVNAPPTVLNRASMRGRFGHGQPNVSEELERGVRAAFAVLSPEPQILSERGEVCAARTADGALIVTIGDASPIYRDGERYPVSYVFTVRLPRIGDASVEADVPYSVVSRARDELVLRAESEKDAAAFFRFGFGGPQSR